MPVFDDFMVHGMEALTETFFGHPAVYTPAGGGTPIDCYVVLSHDVVFQVEQFDSTVGMVGTMLEALFDIVGEPEHGATFAVVGGSTWAVRKVIENNKNVVKMVVET